MEVKQPFAELISILEEEAEIVDNDRDTDSTDKIDSRSLLSAARKIKSNGPTTILSAKEKSAVKDALGDLGDLYRLAGTSSGFNTLTSGEARAARNFGSKALQQASSLGIYL